ncbi:MAG TPA: RNA polymerase sigma factor [Parasegetibacter sp.]
MQSELYQRFAPKMYGVCLRYASQPDDAQDILQEGFVKVFRNIDRFRMEGSFEGWIRRIMVNTAIEFFRRKNHLQPIGEREEQTLDSDYTDALDHLAEKDILTLIRQLSPGYRTVFNMYVIEGYSHKEIAEMLGINEGTSKSQLARAKGLLQKMVEDFLHEKRTKSKSGS